MRWGATAPLCIPSLGPDLTRRARRNTKFTALGAMLMRLEAATGAPGGHREGRDGAGNPANGGLFQGPGLPIQILVPRPNRLWGACAISERIHQRGCQHQVRHKWYIGVHGPAAD